MLKEVVKNKIFLFVVGVIVNFFFFWLFFSIDNFFYKAVKGFTSINDDDSLKILRIVFYFFLLILDIFIFFFNILFNQIKKVETKLINSYTLIDYENVYRSALESLSDAEIVKATFIMPPEYLWQLFKEERGYKEQEEVLVKTESYFEKIDSGIKSGKLKFFWIIAINSEKKFEALVDRCNTVMKIYKEKTTIRDITYNIKVINLDLDQINSIPSINFQYVKKGNNEEIVNFTPWFRERYKSMAIENKSLVKSFNELFKAMFDSSLEIIKTDSGIDVKYENIREIGRKLKLSEEKISSEINNLKEKKKSLEL